MPHTIHALRALSACFWLALGGVAAAHAPADGMRAAADRFLAALRPDQRATAQTTFDDPERADWHYMPDKFVTPDGRRAGLALRDMGDDQRPLAMALLASALTHEGLLDAATIMTLEGVLRDQENGNPIRDPALYYVTVFGEPERGPWGWRFEGHHLSVNIAVSNGRVVALTPSFLGANPAVVPSGPRAGLAALAPLEELARELVESLGPEQRRQAIFSDDAPEDILSGEQRSVDRADFEPAVGVAYGDLNPEQQALLRRLVAAHTARYRGAPGEGLRPGIGFATEEAHFAWAGATAPGEGHYYRLQTADHLIEYDNTQNGANHIHAVWRSFDHDFAVDLLGDHLRHDHSGR
ncbi:DUF3500 domain-containing protein [Botrimarina sp.]|uniref:DUF3500 domain-containing protein n=1 Tax=Botrimarina sp. TaxID=2795802 RepID=UPI0032EFD865